MESAHTARRVPALAATGLVFALVLFAQAFYRAEPESPARPRTDPSWPMWGGTPRRNLVNLVEKGIATDWDNRPGKEKNILWSVRLGSKAVWGGPTIAGGKIFLGTNNQYPRDKAVKGDKGVLMAFRESDGVFLWQIVHDKLEAGRDNDWPEVGIASGPAVEAGRLWYVNNRCEVVCATDGGRVVWKLDMIRDLGVFPHNLTVCSPLVVGDTLFVVTSNGVDEGHINVPAPNAPSFLALDKRTGKVLWSSNLPGKKIMHGQWSSPVYVVVRGKAQVIFPGGDGWLYSFVPKTGELIWKFDCNPKGSVYRLGGRGTRSDFVATPVVWEDKLYVAVGQDPEHKKGVGHLWCIDITKTPSNKEKDLSPYSDPKVEVPRSFDRKDRRNKDSGLVWHYGGNDPDQEAQREYFFGRTLSTCAVDRGLCYACEFDGVLHCLDAATGKKHWEFDMNADTWSSPAVMDGKVYIGNESGAVHVFEHSAKRKLVNTVKMKGKVRLTPIACNGVLYVVTENPCKLFAIKTK